MRTDIDDKKEWIIQELESGESRNAIARTLKCKVETLVTRLKKWDVMHLKNRSGKGKPKIGKRIHVSEYLGINKKIIKSYRLKGLLWRDGYKHKQCEICNGVEWNGVEIPLELDHINGDRYDNRLENLRILCPNCHAQTDTYRGRNKKNSGDVV